MAVNCAAISSWTSFGLQGVKHSVGSYALSGGVCGVVGLAVALGSCNKTMSGSKGCRPVFAQAFHTFSGVIALIRAS